MFLLLAFPHKFPKGLQAYYSHSGIFAKQQTPLNGKQVGLRLHQSITAVYQDNNATFF